MKNGTCPKCHSSAVHSGAHISLKGGSYGSNKIPLGGLFGKEMTLDNYVCCECGYVESYISKPADLERVRKHWPKV